MWIQANPRRKARFEDSRQTRFLALQKELEDARVRAAEKAAAHKTFTPEELAERFPLFSNLTPEQREVLLLHFETRTAQPGDRIIRAGRCAGQRVLHLLRRGGGAGGGSQRFR